jgi:hypothetical protein
MHMHKWRCWFSGLQYPWVLAWRRLKSLLIDVFTGISCGLVNGQLSIESYMIERYYIIKGREIHFSI